VAEFPTSPLPPAEFFEDFLPRAFGEAGLPDALASFDLALGVKLEGEGGGEWLLQLVEGRLSVAPGSRAEAAFTVVQRVEDWRGALWEGRGGAIGQQAVAVFRPETLAAGPSARGLVAAPSPAALTAMRELDGLLRMVVTGAEGDDWAVGFKLGPGAIPEEATTTITLSAADAAALGTGELNPLEAFMAGRIQVAGDVGLVLQMQAIQLEVSEAER